jgi:peptidoglycan/LPS O-acetylase OafA/YrhL
MTQRIIGAARRLREWWHEEPKRFTEAFDPKNNGIGFMRLGLASLVIVSHAYPLGGHFGKEILVRISRGQVTLGALAVSGFFILSGFLIAASHLHLKSTTRYLWHRFLRIMPGFLVSLVVVAFGFGALFYYHFNHTLSGYLTFAPGGSISYITKNFFLTMNQYDISGLTNHLAYPGAFNGSLWTLRYEFACYLIIAVFGLFGLLKHNRFVVLLAAMGVYIIYTVNVVLPGSASRVFPVFNDTEMLLLLTVFLCGTIFYLYRDKIMLSNRYFLLVLLVFGFTLREGGFSLLMPLVLSYGLMYLAAHLPIKSFDRKLDLSYGVYIYAFPVQQTLSLYGLNNLKFPVYCLVVLLITLLLALLSYTLVERPAMKLKHANFRPREAMRRVTIISNSLRKLPARAIRFARRRIATVSR